MDEFRRGKLPTVSGKRPTDIVARCQDYLRRATKMAPDQFNCIVGSAIDRSGGKFAVFAKIVARRRQISNRQTRYLIAWSPCTCRNDDTWPLRSVMRFPT